MKVFYWLVLLSLMIHSENYELKYLKDKSHISKGFGFHTDIGYGSYLIELHSSEMDSAIDYDVLEFTLGVSYTYDRWIIGLYGKFLLDELTSNMYLTNGENGLNNHAKIDKDEFAFYLNHTFQSTEIDRWKLNLIYRYASLDAVDKYNSFYNYHSDFNYQTNGLAFSLVYLYKLTEEDFLQWSGGVVYSRANININGSTNQHLQDSFVDDKVDSVGYKASIAYHRKITNNFSLDIRFDGWEHDFKKVNIGSRVDDFLPDGKLKEEFYSSYGGFTWKF